VNKSGLIDAVSKTTSLAKREAEEAVNAVVHVVASEVRSGRRVVVAGFGSFNPTHRGARMGRNPQTGEAVSIRASKGMRFAPSTLMKDILNGKAALPVPRASASAKKSAGPSAQKSGQRSAQRSAQKSAQKSAKKTVKAARKAVKRSSTRPASRASTRTTRRPASKVVGRAPARKAAKRAPASKATQQSARKAAGRSPVRAAKRPARRP